jgi:hypothetical protein
MRSSTIEVDVVVSSAAPARRAPDPLPSSLSSWEARVAGMREAAGSVPRASSLSVLEERAFICATGRRPGHVRPAPHGIKKQRATTCTGSFVNELQEEEKLYNWAARTSCVSFPLLSSV